MTVYRNKVTLTGNLGADPEIRVTPTNRRVASFRMATNEEYQNSQGEMVKDVQWHHLVAWGKWADIAAAELRKGSRVCIEGKLVYRNFEDREGRKRYITEITVTKMQLQHADTSVDLPVENET